MQPWWILLPGCALAAVAIGIMSRHGVGYIAQRYASVDMAQARALVSRALLRPMPPNAPADLADPWRHHWTSADGRPLGADLSEMDARWTVAAGAPTVMTMMALTTLPAALMGYGEIGLIIICMEFLLRLFSRVFTDGAYGSRAKEMEPQQLRRLLLDDGAASSAESAAFIAAGGSAWASRHEQARQAQLENAMRDTSPVLRLGAATGVLAGRGDPLAPSAGMPVAMSLTDLCQHLLISGGTGSGKTSLIRSLVRQVAGWEDVGLLLMDGAKALGAEMAPAVPGLQVIDPAKVKVSLVEGVTPTQLAEVIQERLGGAQDRFWVDSAAGLLRQGAVIVKAAKCYSLANAYRVAAVDSFRAQIMERLGDPGDDLELEAAIQFFALEWPTVDPKTKSGIIQTLRAVYLQVAANSDMMRWCETLAGESDVDVTSCLRGGRVAIVAPTQRYGSAGPLASSLLKMRIYNALKGRADTGGIPEGETALVMVVDEFQAIALKNKDADMAATGRSLGVAMVLATQTVDGLVAALGAEDAAAVLQVVGSHVALRGRSEATDAMIAKRVGSTFRASIQSMPGVPSTRAALTIQAAAGSRAAAKHHPDIADAISWDDRGVDADLMRRRGFGSLQFAREELDRIAGQPNHKANEMAMVSPICAVGVTPLVDPAEVQELVKVPASALVDIVRGGVARRDVVDLDVSYS